MVQLEHDLLSVASLLAGADVAFAVLKGTATAHLDHADPGDRQFGDLDLLVDPRDLVRALAVLEAAGWEQAYRLPKHHHEFTHAVTLGSGSRTELDVHQRIAHRALGRLVPTEELLARRERFAIVGRPLWALSAPDRLVHAAIHAVSSRDDYRRLSSTLDVLVLARAQAGSAEEVLRHADRWRVRSLVLLALRQAHDAARVDLPEAWAQAAAQHSAPRDRLSTVLTCRRTAARSQRSWRTFA